jgi:hypothetical protein
MLSIPYLIAINRPLEEDLRPVFIVLSVNDEFGIFGNVQLQCLLNDPAYRSRVYDLNPLEACERPERILIDSMASH